MVERHSSLVVIKIIQNNLSPIPQTRLSQRMIARYWIELLVGV